MDRGLGKGFDGEDPTGDPIGVICPLTTAGFG